MAHGAGSWPCCWWAATLVPGGKEPRGQDPWFRSTERRWSHTSNLSEPFLESHFKKGILVWFNEQKRKPSMRHAQVARQELPAASICRSEQSFVLPYASYHDMNVPVYSLSRWSVLCSFQSMVCIFSFSSPRLSRHLLLFRSWFLHAEVGSVRIFFQR